MGASRPPGSRPKISSPASARAITVRTRKTALRAAEPKLERLARPPRGGEPEMCAAMMIPH
jgi:hypothetical protein